MYTSIAIMYKNEMLYLAIIVYTFSAKAIDNMATMMYNIIRKGQEERS